MIIRRILIANRGEIAVRIIRTCRDLGVETVLAASEADLDSVPARLADRTICIGPPRSSGSYLNVEAIIGAAVRAEADAIHPGYGFLSENVRLARSAREHGLLFVGPTDANLEAVGDKLRARAHAVEAGLPLAAGGSVDLPEKAAALAERIRVAGPRQGGRRRRRAGSEARDGAVPPRRDRRTRDGRGGIRVRRPARLS